LQDPTNRQFKVLGYCRTDFVSLIMFHAKDKREGRKEGPVQSAVSR